MPSFLVLRWADGDAPRRQPVSAPSASSVRPETTRPSTATSSRKRPGPLGGAQPPWDALVDGDARGEPQLGQEGGCRGQDDQGDDAGGGGGGGDHHEGVADS